MYKGNKITIVIPCLNEEEGLPLVLDKIPDFVDETIVVDNGSTDRTAEIALEMGATLIHEKIPGYGRAYKTGLANARGDIIVTLDGDHSYPIDAISYLIESLLRSGVCFVSASRFPIQDRDAMSLKHKFGNIVLSLFTSLLFLRWVRDSQSGMWIFYRNILPKMSVKSDLMAFSEEIKIEAIRNREIGFKEIPINFTNRKGEIKLQPWRDGFRNLFFLFKKRLSP